MYCSEESVLVTLLRLFGAPRSYSASLAVICHPHSDSAPGDSCPTCPPSLRPSWNVNSKLLRVFMHTACVTQWLLVLVVECFLHCSHLIFYLLWTIHCSWEHVYLNFISHSCHVRRFVELRNFEMPHEILKISWYWFSLLLYVKIYWFVSLWC